MSVTIAKGGKRTITAPTSRRTSASTALKSRTLASKSARAKPLPKKPATYKAPPRKATKSIAVAKPKPVKATKAANKSANKSTAKVTAKRPVAPKKRTVAQAAHRNAAKPAKRSPSAKKPVARTAKTVAVKSKGTKAPAKKSVAKRPAKPNKPVKAKAPVKTALKNQRSSAPTLNRTKPAPTTTFRPATKPVAAKPPVRPPSQDEAAALRLFESSRREFAAGRFSEARTQFRQLIDKYSGISEIAARARTYLTITETRLRADASLPRDADSLYDRGVIELNRGDFVAAQEMFERALKKEPAAAHIFYGLAATRARLGALESALQSLQRALDLQPSLRVRAQHDHDLQTLRNEPEFEHLVFGART